MDQEKIQEIEEIRVVTIVGAANPELHRELAGTPVRARAERLRLLASHGLACLQTAAMPSAKPGKGADDSRSAVPSTIRVQAVSKRKTTPKASANTELARQVVEETRDGRTAPTATILSESSDEASAGVSAMTAHPSLSLFARSLGR